MVRASDRQSEDPGSIPGRAALCFFRLIQLSVHICRIEKRKEFDWMEWSRQERIFEGEELIFVVLGHVNELRVTCWLEIHFLPEKLNSQKSH